MIIDSHWRILTIGDGDLSFSNALKKHYQPASLTATVYDSLTTLSNKYDDQCYHSLKKQNIETLFNFDICNESSWGNVTRNNFDVVIFQFPLLPAFTSFSEYQKHCATLNPNILNRKLLRNFLVNSADHFLDPNGQQLCFITSKDVKPYRQWNIENALHLQTDIHYLGSTPFDIEMFPGYKVRNVDRDKHVKDTRGITYVWSRQANHPLAAQLQPAQYQGENYCSACRAGPFSTPRDAIEHEQSKKHQNTIEMENLWLTSVQNSST